MATHADDGSGLSHAEAREKPQFAARAAAGAALGRCWESSTGGRLRIVLYPRAPDRDDRGLQAGRKTVAILVLIKQVIGTRASKPVAAPVFVRYDEAMTDTLKTMTGAEFSQSLADLGWRQTEFAARTGTSPDTINRWCNDRQPVPAWAAAHVRLLLAADHLHRLHIAPTPRTRRKAGADDQPAGCQP